MTTMGEPAFGGSHLHSAGPLSSRTPGHDWPPQSAKTHDWPPLSARSHDWPPLSARSHDWPPLSAKTPGHDWAPYSAVSSFNLPAQYDSSLITPTTMAPSAHANAKAISTLKDKEIKLSPRSMESPTYPTFGGDPDDFGSRHNPPMKQKEPSSNSMKVVTTTAAEPYPQSPLFCPDPYYGSFGVSAGPKVERASELISPDANPSPQNPSSACMSVDVHRSPQPTLNPAPHSYRIPHNPPPILIAPNPHAMRAATRPVELQYRDPYRQDSINPVHQESMHSIRQDSLNSMNSAISTSMSMHSMNSLASTPTPHSYQDESMMPLGPLPARRKRKTPPTELEPEMFLSNDITHEEQVLIELVDIKALPWKEVAQKFNAETGKNMKVPALQMRRKRLRERLRVWTDCEERALHLAMEDYVKGKYEILSELMVKHGLPTKLSKEAVQKRCREEFGEDEPYNNARYNKPEIYTPRRVEEYTSYRPEDYESHRPEEYVTHRPEDYGAHRTEDYVPRSYQPDYRICVDSKMEPRTPWVDEDHRDRLLGGFADDETLVGEFRSRTASDASAIIHMNQQHQQQQMLFEQQQQQHHEQQQSQQVWGVAN